MSKVYFLKLKNPSISQVFLDFFDEQDKVAVNLHFGEENNKTYWAKQIIN